MFRPRGAKFSDLCILPCSRSLEYLRHLGAANATQNLTENGWGCLREFDGKSFQHDVAFKNEGWVDRSKIYPGTQSIWVLYVHLLNVDNNKGHLKIPWDSLWFLFGRGSLTSKFLHRHLDLMVGSTKIGFLIRWCCCHFGLNLPTGLKDQLLVPAFFSTQKIDVTLRVGLR